MDFRKMITCVFDIMQLDNMLQFFLVTAILVGSHTN